jgi:NADH-quinone oxidoreductase subunit H
VDWLPELPYAVLVAAAIKTIVIVFLMVFPLIAYTVYAERRLSAIMQDRVGPNRVGIPGTKIRIFGLGQPIADGLKFLLKEDFTPGHVRKFYYWLAPALVLIPALLTVAVLPIGSELKLPGLEQAISLVIADIDVGPLFIFAIASLGVYGIVLAGWASNSKYPFLGGVRSSCQMISYEIAMGLSIVPVLLIYGELNLGAIVRAQSEQGWLLFLPFWVGGGEDALGLWARVLLWVPVLIAFVIFLTSVFAETNRTPFDLPECETELVAGYHTEYSSMKFALFFLGEYAAMIVGSGIVVTLFLGGWAVGWGFDGWLESLCAGGNWLIQMIPGIVSLMVFGIKLVLFLLFFIAVRWTVPRFRYDQLMRLGWVVFFEVALANVVLVAAVLLWIG